MAIVHATEESFAREVLESKQPVLVDFWAAWCGPCRMLAPLLEQAAEQNPDCKVVKVDVDAWKSRHALRHREYSDAHAL